MIAPDTLISDEGDNIDHSFILITINQNDSDSGIKEHTQ